MREVVHRRSRVVAVCRGAAVAAYPAAAEVELLPAVVGAHLVARSTWPDSCRVRSGDTLTADGARSGAIVAARQRQGRSRPIGVGRFHQRPENRHERERGGVVAATTTGFGHSASVAATIAAASSAVGAGDTDSPLGGGSSGVALTTSMLGVLVAGRPGGARACDDDARDDPVVERTTLRVEQRREVSEQQDR